MKHGGNALFLNGYFKGWYFKCTNAHQTVAFIPALHRKGQRKTASLQIILDDAAYQVPADRLLCKETPLSIQIGDNTFSDQGIKLNLNNDQLTVQGTLHFHQLSPIRYDIMGPFALIPFMQCRHSVYSMRHRVDGQITINSRLLQFQNGIGYLEGDRGRSFPRQYLWTQCCMDNGSLMLSVADIPFCGFHFTGIIGILQLNGKEHRIATYLGAKVKTIKDHTVTVEQGDYSFTASLLQKNPQPLTAPIHGSMNRIIRESAACKAYYRISLKESVLCEFVSNRASFEFEYNESKIAYDTAGGIT